MRPLSIPLVATLALLISPPVVAQDRTQPPAPPARVGRVAALSGTVSFHLAGAEQWDRASINLPLTDGSALWTQPAAGATIGFAGNQIMLDAATEFDLDQLDDHNLVGTQPQGESYWRLLNLPSGDGATVRTPRGSVTFAAAGRYEVASGDAAHPTEITVLEGAARVTGLPADVEIGPNQTLTIPVEGAPTLRAVVRDAFLERALAAERAPVRHVALPPSVALMTGSEVLAEQGEWGETPDYGPVWYPPVRAGFVPYRDGHWAYVSPWGWTWVDDAPWGFAPSHYGRWATFGGRWGWVPGRDWAPERRPVYAPALVAFVAGAAAGSWIGWAPLGPHDAYRPPFRSDPRYVEAFNRPTGAQNGAMTNVTVINRQAMTVVPAQAMAGSVNVVRVYRAAPTFATQAVQGPPPVLPTRATVGATPAVLREVDPRGFAGPGRPGGPGPAITAGVAAPLAALPEIRRPGVPSAPSVPGVPGAPSAPGMPPSPERPAFGRPEYGRPEFTRPEFARPDAARPEFARPEGARPEFARPEGARPEFARPGPSRPDVAGPEFARPEIARPNVPRPEFARPEPARPEPARPEFTRPEFARPAPHEAILHQAPPPERPEPARPQPVRPEPMRRIEQERPPPMRPQPAPENFRPAPQPQPQPARQAPPPPQREHRPEERRP